MNALPTNGEEHNEHKQAIWPIKPQPYHSLKSWLIQSWPHNSFHLHPHASRHPRALDGCQTLS